MNRRSYVAAAVVLGLAASVFAQATKKAAPPKKVEQMWTDAAQAPEIFKYQGEYEGTAGSAKIGVQVIAMGGDAFTAVFLPGGLPGAGWDGKNKIVCEGKLADGKLALVPFADTKAKYCGANGNCPTVKFPPEGQKNYNATIADGQLTGKTDTGDTIEAKRAVRQSPTLGATPPAGAIVLFDGSSNDAFSGGRLDAAKKVLCTDGKDIVTKQNFSNYTVHVEFMLPFKPTGRGQGRGNSGFYQVNCYEVQVLDSFGLEGKNNECGGIYTKAEPKVNMCLPPLQWQTYDVEFTNAVFENGKKTKDATITVKHNGVVIHENFAINGPTGGGRKEDGTPGQLKLQGHGNPLQYRNIWIVEKK